jgi:predicted pyridoxine 5'-phosphate oxidase superfamily flavin-nucleotide-binding protein
MVARTCLSIKYIQNESRKDKGEETMVKLTADMKEAFGKMKVFPVATASKDGTPNVIPLGISWLMGYGTV